MGHQEFYNLGTIGIDLESIEWIVAYVIVEELWNPPLWQELSAVWIMNKNNSVGAEVTGLSFCI